VALLSILNLKFKIYRAEKRDFKYGFKAGPENGEIGAALVYYFFSNRG
jgi:hypothetical protein